MLILGLISILQITILPGLIIIILIGLKTETAIQKWLYVFSISLFSNYVLVTILTLFSLYSVSALWVIIIFEIFSLLIFYRGELNVNFLNINFREIFFRFKIFFKNNNGGNRVLIIISGLISLFYFTVFIANIGTIFYFIDTVNNYEWNRWAIDFANNILPKYSSHFPQLLPANWSICYVIIGKTDVHFFPKFIMPLFFIGNLLIFLDLALTKKNNIYLLGLIIYGLFAPIVFSLVFIADGNADLPVSFFSFMTFYAFVKYSPVSNDKNVISFPEILLANKYEIIKNYLFVFLFASMAAATKLAGAYVFTLTSFTLLSFLFWRKINLNKKDIIRILLYVFVICILALFWYLRSPEVMASGLNQPEYLSPEGYSAIVYRALKLMYFNFGLTVCVFLIITVGISLFNFGVRYIAIIMVLIPIVIWMFKYSVDFRNLSFVIPFISFSSAVGLSKILDVFNFKHELQTEESKSLKVNSDLRLNSRGNIILFLSLSGSGLLALYTLSDKFYLLLFNIYEFVYKYYFQIHRIVYFIEYDLQLHVDFYQRTFLTLFAIIFVSIILIISKTRLVTVFKLLYSYVL